MLLFGNPIARRFKQFDTQYGMETIKTTIKTCGYKTATTLSRLRALQGVDIKVKSGKWYLNGKEWSGIEAKITG
jgi:hypothetical protein